MKRTYMKFFFSLLATVSIVAVGCGKEGTNTNEVTNNTESIETSITDESTPAASNQEVELLYGTVNLTYANFYYGELNDIEPELTATSGQYQAESKVNAAGYLNEGMYDAVTSATKQKSTGFAASYYEEVGDGANIIGVANVNVAISKALYEDVTNAISQGTICSNELIELVSEMTLSDTVPCEYKVINSDGTVSKTIGETQVATDVTATFTSISSWGNYQFSFEGIEIDAAQMMGAIMETSDGCKYGLEHEDNLWLRAGEVSFCVVPFTEPHGNEVAYQRFADMQGKTITKFTYLLKDGPDIEIPVNAFVYKQLEEGFQAAVDSQVTYDKNGTVISYSLTTPEGSDYQLSMIKFGRSAVDLAGVEISDTAITLPESFGPGSYTFIFEDELYAAMSASAMVDSGLTEGDITFDGEGFVIKPDCGLTVSQWINNFGSITVNGEPVSGRGLSGILFDETGKLLMDAAIEQNDSSTPVFPDGKNEISITAAGFPEVTFTFEK